MARKLAAGLVVILTAFASLAPLACGQGLLLHDHPGQPFRFPRPIWPTRPEPLQQSYTIESLDFRIKIEDIAARVQVSQTFKNTGSGQLEARFLFPLPYDSAIDQLTLMVDGKEFPAKLLPKEEARRRFEEIVRNNRDPALLEWMGGGLFQTSVFPIPPGESRTVMLRYTQLCRRSQGLTEFMLPLRTARHSEAPLKSLRVEASVVSPEDIKNVYSPTHDVEVDREGKRSAVITFHAKATIPADDFRLYYDTGRGSVKASVLSYRPDRNEDGYFLALATPEIQNERDDQDVAPKTVIVVVDRSGSMSGEKMAQAKEGVKYVINHLRKRDAFNVIAYDSEIEAFRPELAKVNDETRDAAIGFANGLYTGGSTNIAGALDRAMAMLKDSERPSYVIFLTDGLPTVGETKEAAIVEQANRRNNVRARLFTFGVGYDVNSRLLDKLSSENFGRSDYVRPEEDVEDAITKLYSRIGAPVMTGVELSLDVEDARASDGAVASRTYPHDEFDLFAGDQAVIVGRYRVSGAAKVRLKGEIGDKEVTFDFPAKLAKHSDDDANAFVARLWATRRVGAIIDDIDLHGRNDELVKELVDLATQHGILTPYTSFLADETTVRDDRPAIEHSVREHLSLLDSAEGAQSFRQREAKSEYRFAARPAAAGDWAHSAGGYADRDSIAGAIATATGSGGQAAWYFDAVEDKPVVSTTCMTVGRKTFFRRAGVWIDSALAQQEIDAAVKIERFSDEYFGLVEKHGRHVTALLAINGPVCVKLDGKVYRW